jgi:hypothetical protein
MLIDCLHDMIFGCLFTDSEVLNDGMALTFIMNWIKKDKYTHFVCNVLYLFSKCVTGFNYDQKASTKLLKV